MVNATCCSMEPDIVLNRKILSQFYGDVPKLIVLQVLQFLTMMLFYEPMKCTIILWTQMTLKFWNYDKS